MPRRPTLVVRPAMASWRVANRRPDADGHNPPEIAFGASDLALGERELANVGVAVAEQVGAAG